MAPGRFPQGALITWAVMMEGGMQLNARGERFHDETQGYSEAAVHVLAQPGGVAWDVFDGPILALARGFPDFCAAEAAGALKTCADAQALAALIGCDTEKIIAMNDPSTLGNGQNDSINGVKTPRAGVRSGLCCPRTTRSRSPGRCSTPRAGWTSTPSAACCGADGTPFANLLAAGGAARGVSGNAVWGYLSGNGLLSAVAGGAIAAETAKGMVKT